MRRLLILVLGAALLVGCGGSKAVTPTPNSLPAPTTEAQSVHSLADILTLATQQVGALPVSSLPQGAHSVRCASAEYIPATRMWAVLCDFFSTTLDTLKADTVPMQSSIFTVNDADGKLVK